MPHSTLEHGTDSTGLNEAFRVFCHRRCGDRPDSRHRHALPCLLCFREVLVHPVTTEIFRHVELGWDGRHTVLASATSPEVPVGHTFQVFLVPHRGQDLPKSTRTKTIDTYFYISIHFSVVFFFLYQTFAPFVPKEPGSPLGPGSPCRP